MKKIFTICLAIIIGLAHNGAAQNTKRRASKKPKVSRKSSPAPKTLVTPLSAADKRELSAALKLAKSKQYQEASVRLHRMSRDPRFRSQTMQIKYILGLMLYEMKFYQSAAYQFVEIIRAGNARYTPLALQKLALVADALNDDTLLNYALSRISLTKFPRQSRDMLQFRIGEYQYRSGLYDRAVRTLAQVPSSSTFYGQAKYLQGLAYAEQNKLSSALKSFASLVKSRRNTQITDTNRVAGLMGIARTYYQQKRWDRAIEFYRRIPRDSEYWHDALFEMSWAQMRASQFRGVLSNFHSLHSPFYEDYYLAESVLLRSIVYLYLCQYDEMEKTIDLFERVYSPVLKSVAGYLKSNHRNIKKYYQDYEAVKSNIEHLKEDPEDRKDYAIPFLVVRKIMKEGDVHRNEKYIDNLQRELDLLQSQPDSWKKSSVGAFVAKALNSRMRSAKERGGRLIRNHMVNIYKDLRDLSEQNSFARYELLSSKKEALKKQLVGKGVVASRVDENNNRSYYIQNGYEYWPFEGEYWLDEIGNYYYLGNHSCE